MNFVAAVKDLYPGCEGDDRYCRADLQYLVQEYRTKPMQSQQDLGEYRRKFLKVASLLIATRKLSDTERDDLFLRGFPPEVEGKIRHRLLVVKSDLHPDNPYPIVDTHDAAKFLLTGSASRSSFQSSLLMPATSTPPRQPYHQAYQPPQQTYQPPTHQSLAPQLPSSQVKQEFAATTQNQFRNGNCNFCGGPGHFTRSCIMVCEYIQASKISHGQDGRLYFVDGSRIPRIPGLQFIKECVDHVEAECTEAATMSTSSTATSANFVRDPPPHMRSGILAITYPDTDAVLDIDSSAFAVQVSTSLNVAEPDFQPYIAQAWASFQAERGSKDSRPTKRVCFDGVAVPTRQIVPSNP
jgi:hypothetical protein